MGEEESRGFVIRDRRAGAEGTGAAPDRSTASASQPKPTPAERSQESAHSHEPAPPLTFASFVFSLGTSALMLMGEQLDPQQERPQVNLSQAKEIIDILSLLDSKTRGNLTSDEQAVLGDMLYALRIKYVDLASGKQATKSP